MMRPNPMYMTLEWGDDKVNKVGQVKEREEDMQRLCG
jgi:hypothetical protein